MTKRRSDTEAGSPAGGSARPRAREERLSAALRSNLARRKVQARARRGADKGYQDKAQEADQADRPDGWDPRFRRICRGQADPLERFPGWPEHARSGGLT